MQLLSDAGINPFGAVLVGESLLRSPIAEELRAQGKPLRFFLPINRQDCAGWAGVEMTLTPIPIEKPVATADSQGGKPC